MNITEEKIELKRDIIQNIKSYHKEEIFPFDHYKNWKNKKLLTYCHPNDREDFEYRIRKIKLAKEISNEETIE